MCVCVSTQICVWASVITVIFSELSFMVSGEHCENTEI